MIKKDTINLHLQYGFKCDGTILDTQYSEDENYLAAVTSNGSIFVYKNSLESNTEVDEQLLLGEYHNRDNFYLKVAWGVCTPDVLAVCTINKKIECFKIVKNGEKDKLYFKAQSCDTVEIIKIADKHFQYIPFFVTWHPSPKHKILTAGFSNGMITLFNENLSEICQIAAHEESVNWIAWQPIFYQSPKNNWIPKYYPKNLNSKAQTSSSQEILFASGSSDCVIKIWKLNKKEISVPQMDEGESLSPQILYSLEEKYKICSHTRQIRQVTWRPNFFKTKDRFLVSCSQDGFVRFYHILMNEKGKISHQEKSFKCMKGPVFRAQYNHLGTMIGISFQAEQEGKVTTVIYKDQNGILGEQLQLKK